MLKLNSSFVSLSLIACAAFSSAVALASPSQVNTRVTQVEAPSQSGAPYEVLAADGRVYSVPDSNRKLAEALEKLAEDKTPVHLIVENDEITGFTRMDAAEAAEYRDPFGNQSYSEITSGVHASGAASESPKAEIPAAIQEANRYGYEPTILSSMDEAWDLFRSERALNHSSQCHNRAMVWSYEMWRDHNVKSMKVMMFFSNRFRNAHLRIKESYFLGIRVSRSIKPYKWWYHTAPFVYVGNQEVVLDSEFLTKPVTLDQWTHFFLSEFVDRWATILSDQPNRKDYRGYLVDKDGDPILYTPSAKDGMLGFGWSEEKPYYIPIMNRLGWDQTQCRVVSKTPTNEQLASSSDWCLVRKLPMYYHQPESFRRFDCNPQTDPAPGRDATRLNDGRLKYPCLHEELSYFPKDYLERAYSDATQREGGVGTEL